MLDAKYRFHGHNSLRYVYKNGRMVRSKTLTIRYANNPNRVHSRVAVVVAKKVIKAAPKRNRIRRRVFEAIRLDWDHIAAHHDLIISVNSPELLMTPFETLRAELLALIHAGHIEARHHHEELETPTETK